jgi:type I restriction enzyme M protein
MLTGEIRSQIDQIWNAFWSGGISNPLEVIEQITYLLFLKRLDEQEIAEELKANSEKKPMQKRFFHEDDDSGRGPMLHPAAGHLVIESAHTRHTKGH